MEKVIENKIKIIKLAVDYYRLVEILKYTECGNQLEVRTNNKRIIWYLNGQLDHRVNYTKGGKLNGLYESWYTNGQICNRCNFTNGKLNGLYELWYYDGQINRRIKYTDGKIDGLYEIWYPNGQLFVR
jgi:antitoxin component YwqK of YwqJK toxin-antitoxin module